MLVNGSSTKEFNIIILSTFFKYQMVARVMQYLIWNFANNLWSIIFSNNVRYLRGCMRRTVFNIIISNFF